MQLISCHKGRLLTSALAEQHISRPKVFTTGLSVLDELLPHGGFVHGAIHEILAEKKHGMPRFFSLLLARSAAPSGAVIWCDPRQELYPPAVEGLGIPLDRFYLLHPKTISDQTWALAECLRCKGVTATIAQIERIS